MKDTKKSSEKLFEKINIITVTDDNYAQHLGVMLYSLLVNSKNNNYKNIYIIEECISENNKIKLKDVVEQFGANIFFKTINKEKYSNFYTSNHISLATYYRISIPEIIEFSAKKAIYLDCDLIIKEDISKLWQIDISDYFIAAVENPNLDRHIDLNIPANSKYFNSGVMLLNLEKWRMYNTTNKVLSFIKNNQEKILLWDQDGLNAILYNNWKSIKPKWNQQTRFFKIKYYNTNFEKEDFLESQKNPCIIHFTGPSKPWNYLNKHPYKNEYYRYLIKTPWKNYIPKDKNYRNIIKIYSKKLLPKKVLLIAKWTLKNLNINF